MYDQRACLDEASGALVAASIVVAHHRNATCLWGWGGLRPLQGVLCGRPGCGDVLLPQQLHGQRNDSGLTADARKAVVEGPWQCCGCDRSDGVRQRACPAPAFRRWLSSSATHGNTQAS